MDLTQLPVLQRGAACRSRGRIATTDQTGTSAGRPPCPRAHRAEARVRRQFNGRRWDSGSLRGRTRSGTTLIPPAFFGLVESFISGLYQLSWSGIFIITAGHPDTDGYMQL